MESCLPTWCILRIKFFYRPTIYYYYSGCKIIFYVRCCEYDCQAQQDLHPSTYSWQPVLCPLWQSVQWWGQHVVWIIASRSIFFLYFLWVANISYACNIFNVTCAHNTELFESVAPIHGFFWQVNFFDEYQIEGVSSDANEICLEVAPDNISRALKTAQNAKSVKIKLTKKHCPCLTLAAELVILSFPFH